MNTPTTPDDPLRGWLHDAGPLINAFRRILRPLVRLALSHGVKHQQLAALLKSVYLDVARDGDEAAGRANVSRLSVLTGIQRKEVKALLQQVEPGSRPIHSHEAELFARWLSDPALTEPGGAPRPLSRIAADDGAGASFESLARAVTSDVHPRTLLDSLLRLGLVRIDEQDRVRALTDRFVPTGEFISLLEFMREHVHDHLCTTVNNVAGLPPMLEQSVYADGLTAGSVDALHELARDAWQQLFRRAVPEARRLVAQDRQTPAEARSRIRIGMYFYAEAEAEAGSESGFPAHRSTTPAPRRRPAHGEPR